MKSRRGKFNLWHNKADQCLPGVRDKGVGLRAKRNKGTFWDDGHVYIWGGVYIGI